MNTYYLNLIPELKNIEYKSKFVAKEILSKLKDNTGHSFSFLFWRLCSILYLTETDEERLDQFEKWLVSAVSISLPTEKIDPFLKAIFTNNRQQYQILSQEYSPYLPVLMPRAKTNRFSNSEIPDYFKSKKFSYGSKEITGEDVWKLLTNDINVLEKYNLPWILLFALYFWYCAEIPENISHTINAFCALQISQNKEKRNENNPIYHLLNYYSQYEKDFSKIITSLTHIDAFFFLNIFTAIEEKPVNHKQFCYVANNAAAVLVNKKHWEYAVVVYNIIGETEKAQLIIQVNSSANLEMTENEKNLIENLNVSEQNVLQAKANKAAYVYQFLSGKDKLNAIGTAIDLSFAAENYNQAYYLIFKEYIPLMSELGDDMLKALQWADLFKGQTFTKEMDEDIKALQIISNATNGMQISQNDLEFIASKMEQKWETFSLRRDVCSLLLQQEDSANYLKNVDAVPRDELVSVLAKQNK